MKKNNKNAVFNFIVPLLTIIGLSVYFTVNSAWSIGAAVIILLLMLIAGFYIWLWKKYFQE